MKKLQLNSENFKVLLTSFKEWLDVLGYSPSTVYNLPNHLREFFHYLEAKGHSDILSITTTSVSEYYKQLSTRANERRGGGLSKAYLNKHQQTLKKFMEFLKEHKSRFRFGVHLKAEKISYPDLGKDILTQEEAKELFEACNFTHIAEHFQLRDKAILVLLYSCGLRRNEAIHIDISDILFERGHLHVRMGKNYKERFVPVNQYNLEILQEYLDVSRPQFLKKYQTDAFILSKIGLRISSPSLANRVVAIVEATENDEIIGKHITPHSLRHSIATHLMQNNVPIQSIAKFLGHDTLESTQVYTHLVQQLEHGS